MKNDEEGAFSRNNNLEKGCRLVQYYTSSIQTKQVETL